MNYDPELFTKVQQLETLVAQQAAVIEQTRKLILVYHCTEHPLYEFALANQPCPEVLNKVRAEAVREVNNKLFALRIINAEQFDTIDEYAQRIEQGEA